MIMARDDEDYSIKTGLVELNIGKLTITSLSATNLKITDKSVIKVNNGAGVVSINDG
jgi:hypothetical protein